MVRRWASGKEVGRWKEGGLVVRRRASGKKAG